MKQVYELIIITGIITNIYFILFGLQYKDVNTR